MGACRCGRHPGDSSLRGRKDLPHLSPAAGSLDVLDSCPRWRRARTLEVKSENCPEIPEVGDVLASGAQRGNRLICLNLASTARVHDTLGHGALCQETEGPCEFLREFFLKFSQMPYYCELGRDLVLLRRHGLGEHCGALPRESVTRSLRMRASTGIQKAGSQCRSHPWSKHLAPPCLFRELSGFPRRNLSACRGEVSAGRRAGMDDI